jgi:hypothetical protein
VIDDAAYVLYARQILAHPGDPYGFEILWNEEPAPQRAFDVLAPPLLPYWLAGSMALLGDEPVRWKLALLPFALALAGALWALAARLAPGLEAPLVWMAVLSPSVLPFLNLMLDVPSLALALLGLALFFAAAERASGARAVAAGLLVGLAMQTKYTGATALAAILVWGALCGRLRLALAAVASAAGVFWGWEAFVSLRYGGSHMLNALLAIAPYRYGASAGGALVWGAGFVILIGALAPAVGLLAAAALGVGARALVAAALAIAAGFAAIAAFPAEAIPVVEAWPRFRSVPAEEWLFAALGLASAACVGAACARLLRRSAAREDRFLALWLAIEVAGFAALSPYLAARRVLGVALVALLLCGRAALVALGPEAARRALRVPLALGAALGVLYAASDFADALAGRDAARIAERRLRGLGWEPDRHSAWFTGLWGFHFYAERAGLRALEPGRSLLRRGDWLVVPEGVAHAPLRAPGASPALAAFSLRGASPWSTQPWAYAGALPLRPRPDALVRVSLHRVLRGFVPPVDAEARRD